MRNNGKALSRCDAVDQFLPSSGGLDQTICTHVHNVRAVGRDLVARDEHHAFVIPLPVVLGRCVGIVVGNGKEVMAKFGVIVDDALWSIGAVAIGGVSVQVASQPFAVCKSTVRVVDLHEGLLVLRS